jgi:release factor glutamine methyltransferase
MLAAIKKAQTYLENKGIQNPKADVLFLLAHAANTTRSKLPLLTRLNTAQEKKFKNYLTKRAKHIPTAHIIGEWDFMGYTFKINKNVLIPRPETELITESAINTLKKTCGKVLDFCAGSGCIGISITKETKAPVTLVDISPKALTIAKKNAKLLNANCKFFLSDGFSKVPKGIKFNMIISNPPYIMEQDFKTLSPEVQKEPKIALTAPDGGLYFYKLIADNARKFLYNDGCVLVELNSKLDKQIYNIFKTARFKNLEFIKDYNGTNIGLKGNI